jgi:hypothetical protein
VAGEAREEEAAEPEGGEGEEGPEPKGWLVGGEAGGAEGEDDRVACKGESVRLDIGGGVGGWDGGAPVCIDTKAPVALKATLSQRPETQQQTISIRSAWCVSMSWCRRARSPCGFDGFTSLGGLLGVGGGSCGFWYVGVVAPESEAIVVADDSSILVEVQGRSQEQKRGRAKWVKP